jgi:hypothetical protein
MTHSRLARFLRVVFLAAVTIFFQVFTHQALGERLPAAPADVMLADRNKDRRIGSSIRRARDERNCKASARVRPWGNVRP